VSETYPCKQKYASEGPHGFKLNSNDNPVTITITTTKQATQETNTPAPEACSHSTGANQWSVTNVLAFKQPMQSWPQYSHHTHLDSDFALDLDWDLDLDLLFLGSDLDLERDGDLDLDLERSRDLLINEDAHQLLAYPLNLHVEGDIKLEKNDKRNFRKCLIRGAKIQQTKRCSEIYLLEQIIFFLENRI
jgi:hypothetical protein